LYFVAIVVVIVVGGSGEWHGSTLADSISWNYARVGGGRGSTSGRNNNNHNRNGGSAAGPPRSIWLLTTDLFARGVHCDDVDYAIQFDFPGNLETYLHRCRRVGRNAISHTNPSSSSPKAHLAKTAVVYSFLTRNLQALAPDLLSLLEAHNQHAWIDPNLRTLAAKAVSAAATNKPKPSKSKAVNQNMNDRFINDDDNGNDDTHNQHHDRHATAGADEESAKATVRNRHDDDDNNNNNNNEIYQKNKRKRKKRPRHERNRRAIDDDEDDEMVWASDRIVLQRAAHISDASSSSSSSSSLDGDDNEWWWQCHFFGMDGFFGHILQTQGLSICQTHICPGKKKGDTRILGILRFKIENALARNVLQNN